MVEEETAVQHKLLCIKAGGGDQMQEPSTGSPALSLRRLIHPHYNSRKSTYQREPFYPMIDNPDTLYFGLRIHFHEVQQLRF